jgi:hypothetical protein
MYYSKIDYPIPEKSARGDVLWACIEDTAPALMIITPLTFVHLIISAAFISIGANGRRKARFHNQTLFSHCEIGFYQTMSPAVLTPLNIDPAAGAALSASFFGDKMGAHKKFRQAFLTRKFLGVTKMYLSPICKDSLLHQGAYCR